MPNTEWTITGRVGHTSRRTLAGKYEIAILGLDSIWADTPEIADKIINQRKTLMALREQIIDSFPDMVDDPVTVQYDWIKMIDKAVGNAPRTALKPEASDNTEAARMVERVSEAFRAALARALMPSQRAEIDRLNVAETTPGICHTHDFCDANMFMDEAMKACGITPLGEDGMTAETAELWNAAWDHAKAAGFSTPIGSVERKPTPGPLVTYVYSTMPNEPHFRVYSKSTDGNVALFYAKADADWFVAGADMLAALRDAETRFSGFGGNDGFAGADDVLARIRAAIAKAEGRA